MRLEEETEKENISKIKIDRIRLKRSVCRRDRKREKAIEVKRSRNREGRAKKR